MLPTLCVRIDLFYFVRLYICTRVKKNDRDISTTITEQNQREQLRADHFTSPHISKANATTVGVNKSRLAVTYAL